MRGIETWPSSRCIPVPGVPPGAGMDTEGPNVPPSSDGPAGPRRSSFRRGLAGPVAAWPAPLAARAHPVARHRPHRRGGGGAHLGPGPLAAPGHPRHGPATGLRRGGGRAHGHLVVHRGDPHRSHRLPAARPLPRARRVRPRLHRRPPPRRRALRGRLHLPLPGRHGARRGHGREPPAPPRGAAHHARRGDRARAPAPRHAGGHGVRLPVALQHRHGRHDDAHRHGPRGRARGGARRGTPPSPRLRPAPRRGLRLQRGRHRHQDRHGHELHLRRLPRREDELRPHLHPLPGDRSPLCRPVHPPGVGDAVAGGAA